MIQAIVDIGSNTVRMAIYNIEIKDGKEVMEMLMKKKDMVGLAGFVENGIMQQAGIDKAVKVLSGYKNFLDKLGIDKVAAFTTAALRNCKNSKDAVQEIINRSRINVRVISGDEEAEFDFVGATHSLKSDSGLLIDIGGGSTELVYFADKKIINKISLPIGSLEIRSKYVAGLFPTKYEIENIREITQKSLASAKGFENIKQKEICGIGGTFKGAAAIYNVIYCDKENVNGGLLSNKAILEFKVETLKEILNRFAKEHLTQEDSLVLLRAIPERLETVLPGIVVADVIAEYFGSEHITYSDSGVREGFIYKEIIG